MDSVSEDQVRLGDFRLLERIGEGGMGVVYRAWQVSLQRLVALKIIRAGAFADEAEISRFRAEAEAVAGLSHPNIVPIHQIGDEQGYHYFTMELVEGESLAQRLSKQGRFSPADAADLLARIARAVHYAHQRGTLHRDLKPGNILLDESGEVYVSDFGLARRLGADSSLTLPGQILGTPNYMAPEQAAGEPQLTVAADVFSLGAIFYELLSGTPPFKGSHVLETLHKVTHETPPPPSRLHELGSNATDLDVICLKCLAKDPSRRYPSAEALALDLESWRRHEPISARPVSPWERARMWSRRHRALSTSIATTFLAILATTGIAIAAAWRLKGERDRTREAELNATLKLAQASLAQARAENLSRASGFRGRSLQAIATAASVAPSLELRNEAILALSSTDLGRETSWNHPRPLLGAPRFSRDLRTVAQAKPDGIVSLIEIPTGLVLGQLPVGPGLTDCLAFSPDDQLLAVSLTGGRIGLWDVVLKTECWTRTIGPTICAVPLQFHPSEPTIYLASPTHRLDVVARSNAAPISSLKVPWAPERFAISPDGHFIAMATGQLVALLDAAEGGIKARFDAPGNVTDLAWHPDGRRVGLGYASGEIALWNPVSKSHQVFAGEPQTVATLAFHPDGLLLASGHWNTVSQLWDVPSGRQILTHRGDLGSAFSRSGDHLVSGRASIREVDRPSHLHTLVGAEVSQLYCLAYSPDGQWIAASSSSGVHVWDSASTALIAASPDGPVARQMAFAANGRSIVLRHDNDFWVSQLDASSGSLSQPQKLQMSMPEDLGSFRRMRSFGGSLFPADLKYHFQSSEVRFVDLSDPTRSYLLTQSVPGPLSLSRLGLELVTFSEKSGEFLIRDAQSPRRRIPAKQPGGVILLNPTKDRLAQFSNSRLTMYSTASGAPQWDRPVETAATMFPSFSKDGSFLAVAGTSSPDVWILDAENGADLATLPGPLNTQVGDLAISPNHQALAVAYQSFIRIWDLTSLRRQLAKLGLDWSGRGEPEGSRRDTVRP